MNDMKTERDFLYKEDKLLREGVKKIFNKSGNSD